MSPPLCNGLDLSWSKVQQEGHGLLTMCLGADLNKGLTAQQDITVSCSVTDEVARFMGSRYMWRRKTTWNFSAKEAVRGTWEAW